MKSRRPEVFVSATSSDLRSCRQLVKEGLLTLGCVPVEQSNFPPDYRRVRDMLRARIARCDAVIHLAGECYGSEPARRDGTGARRSYTQLEYDLARELRKPLYVFLCDSAFSYDSHPQEEAEKRRLQQAHRAALAVGDTLRCEIGSRADLALRVRELQTSVERIAEELKRTRTWLGRGLAVGVTLLLGLGGGLWWVNQRTERTEQRVTTLEAERDRQRRTALAVVEAFTQQQADFDRNNLTEEQRLARVLALVAKNERQTEAGVTAAVRSFIAAVRANPRAEPLDAALADLAQRSFAGSSGTDRRVGATASEKPTPSENSRTQARSTPSSSPDMISPARPLVPREAVPWTGNGPPPAFHAPPARVSDFATVAEDLAVVRARMEKRLVAIAALKDRLVVGETNRGYLEVQPGLDSAEEQVVFDENIDRGKIYGAVAVQTQSTVDQVGRARAAQIAKVEKRGHWVQDPAGEWRQKP